MTHGSIHIMNVEEDFQVKLHTTHDGHPEIAAADLVLLPHFILSAWGDWFGFDTLRERRDIDGATKEEIMDHQRRFSLLEVEPTTLACMMIERHRHTWFPLPHVAEDGLLEYWGQSEPDVVVRANEETGVVTVDLRPRLSHTEDQEWLEEAFDYARDEARMALSENVFKLYTFDKENLSISYNFMEVIVALIMEEKR